MSVQRFPLLLILLVSSCAVGPDFVAPDAPPVNAYGALIPLETEGGEGEHAAAQRLMPGADVPQDWWKEFHSDELTRRVDGALAKSPDLEAADAALRAAEEDMNASEAAFYPSLTGDFSASRQKSGGASNGGNFPGRIYNLYNASVDVSYGIDLFGATRRGAEQAEAARDYQIYERDAARLAVAGNVVTASIREASLRGQIATTEKLIAAQEKQLYLVKQQLAAGAVARGAVLAQETQLAQTRAALPALKHQLEQTRHALAGLMGGLPLDKPVAMIELSHLHLPEYLPLTVPSELVERRPDIRAAEANMQAASAAIGVAEAARLPHLTLSANMGSVANIITSLFAPGGGIWAIGANLGQTFFDGGRLASRADAARARYDQAAALYRKTVLSAFQEVADSFDALQTDAAAVKLQQEAVRASSANLHLARVQFDAGAIAYTALLDAERADQQARIALVQAEAQRLADTAALYQALGGGVTLSRRVEGKKP